MMHKQTQTGFTLVEIMITMSITSVIAGIAVPSYQNMIERHYLKQVLEGLKADMQWARTETIKQNKNIVLSRSAGNLGAWCYGLAIKTSSKSNCDCNITDLSSSGYCDLKRITGDLYKKTTLELAYTQSNSFDSRRGTINAGGVTFSTSNYVARVVFSDLGRVRICTPKPLPTGKTALQEQLSC